MDDGVDNVCARHAISIISIAYWYRDCLARNKRAWKLALAFHASGHLLSVGYIALIVSNSGHRRRIMGHGNFRVEASTNEAK